MCELRTWQGQGLFITLTYDNDHLPADQGLHKDHLQRFWKRLRKDIYPRKLKYYACGEYGDQFGRPHYHAIVFGLSLKDCDLISENWSFGFSKVGSVTYDSARYVAGYVDKKFGVKKNKEVYGELQPPFQVCSQGIGYRYFEAHREDIESVGLTLNGQKMSIPRYFIKKALIDTPGSSDFVENLRDLVHKNQWNAFELQDFIDSLGKQKDLNAWRKRAAHQSVRMK